MRKFVELMMSKFLPVSALRDKELSEVNYKQSNTATRQVTIAFNPITIMHDCAI